MLGVRLHYVEARKAMEAGLVAVVAVRGSNIGTFTHPPSAFELSVLTHGDAWVRAGGLLAFMDKAHERIEEECS